MLEEPIDIGPLELKNRIVKASS